MAIPRHIQDHQIRPIETDKAPALNSTIAKAASGDSFVDRSLLSTEIRSTGLVVNGHTIADPIRSHLSTSRTDFSTTANPKTSRHNSPLILSSRSASSVASNSSGISNIWDSSQTTCRGFHEKFEAYNLTPVTPPMSLRPTKEEAFTVVTPCRSSSTGITLDNRKAGIVPVSKQDVRKDSLVEEEDFEPKRLVRGLTAEFLAIAAANATLAQGKYNQKPNFDFSITSFQSAPALVQKQTRPHIEASNNAQSCRKSRDAKTQASIVAQSVSSRTDVRTLVMEIVPRDLQVRFNEAPWQCVASLIKNPQQRCRYQAKAPWEFDKTYLKSPAQCIDGAFTTESVGKIIQTIFCGAHKNSANRRLDKLQRPIAGLTNVANDELPCPSTSESPMSSCGPRRVALLAKNKEICTRGVPHTETASGTTQTTATATPPFNPASPVPSSTGSYSLEFHPYQPKKWEGVSVQDALRETIKQPLHPTDLMVGFIYVFWDVKHFGMVKIGRTNNLEQRLKKWNSKCKRQHKYHTELPEIPHVSRVERLIHMELKQQRRLRGCDSCETNHNEWFEVSETHAVKVFEKWQQWIAQKPYELDAGSGRWVLRPGLLDSLSQLCEPVLLPPLAESKQRRPPRRSSRLVNQQKRDRGSWSI